MQEAWLKENNKVSMRHFQHPVRKERVMESKSGVLIYSRNKIPFAQVTYNSVVEPVVVKIFIRNKDVTVCNLYIPPKFDNALYEELDKLMIVLEKPFIIVLNFNTHHYVWGSNYVDVRGKLLCDWILSNDYYKFRRSNVR